MAGWSARCAELFPYSTYFKGAKSSAVVGVASSRSSNGGSDSVSQKDINLHTVNGGLRDLVLN